MSKTENNPGKRDWLRIFFWIMTIEVFSGTLIGYLTGFGGMGMGPLSILVGLIFGFALATYLIPINILLWLGLAIAYSIKKRRAIRVEKTITTSK